MSMTLDESTRRISAHSEIPRHCASWGEEVERVSSEAEENLAESRILEVQ